MSEVAASIAQDQLRSFVERIEHLEEDKKTVGEDIKDVYAEAKGNGFDTRILRRVIALRKFDANERAEADALTDLYLDALGMSFQPRLPFGDESPRTVAPSTIQICDADGKPLHPPVNLATMKAAVETVRSGRRSSARAKSSVADEPRPSEVA